MSVSVPIVAKAIAVYPTHRLFVAVLFLGQKTVEDAAVVIVVVVVVQKAVVVTIVQLRGLSRITRVVRVVGVLGRGLGTPGQVEVLLRWGSDGPGIRPGRRLGEDLGNGRRGTGRDAAPSHAGTAGTVTHNTGGDNLLTDKPLMLTYDEASFNNPPTNTDWKILDSEVAYLTFDYPTEAQYVLIQADWDSASIFSLQEVKFLKGKRFQRQQTVKL